MGTLKSQNQRQPCFLSPVPGKPDRRHRMTESIAGSF
jgi:hypothetical protein